MATDFNNSVVLKWVKQTYYSTVITDTVDIHTVL